MQYVLLLRGINVGGKNRVEMARLRSHLEASGFEDVRTYINSGNIIFSSEQKPSAVKIAEALEQEFGFPIPSLLLTGKQIQQIASAIPKAWENNTTDQKSDVLYLFPEADSKETLAELKPRSEFETILYTPGALLSHVPRKFQQKSSLIRIVGTPLYKKMTIRNVTTARRLAEMVSSN